MSAGPLTVGHALLRVVADWSGVDQELSKVDRRMVDSFDALRRKAAYAMTAVGGLIVGGLTVSVKAAMEYEQALARAASVTGATGDELVEITAALDRLALELGGTTVWSAKQCQDAFYDLGSKGLAVAEMSAADLLPILNLASATQYDLTLTTETVTDTLKGFGLANHETSRIADVFVRAIGSSAASMDRFGTSIPIVSATSKILGVSLEETAAVLSVLYDNGIDASTAATGLRNTMMMLNSSADPLHASLGKLKISIGDVKFQTHGVVGVFEHLAKQGLTAEQALEVFGKRNGTIAATIIGTREKVQELTGSYEAAGGAAQTVAEIQLNTLQGSLTLLQSAFESVQIQIGRGLIPAIRMVAETVAPILGQWGAWMQLNPELVKQMTLVAAAVGAALLVLGPMLLVLPGLVALVPALGAVLGAIVSPVGAAVVALGYLAWTLREQVGDALRRARGWFEENWEQIKRILAVWGYVGMTFAKTFVQALQMVARFAALYLGAVVEQFGAGYSGSKDGTESILDLLEQFSRAVAHIFDAVLGVFQAVMTWLGEHWDGIVAITNFAVTAVLKPLAYFLGNAIDFWSTLIGVFDWGAGKVAAIWNWFGRLFGGSGGGTFGGMPEVGRAFGGVVMPGEITRVGEHGPELAVFPAGTEIVPSGRRHEAGAGGGGDTFVVQVNHPVVREDQDIGRIVESVRQAFTVELRRKAGPGLREQLA